MKAFKRISALVISLSMILSCAFSTVAFADTGMTDVAEDNIHYEAINDLVDKGIINGYANEDGTFSFKPDGTITRAEFCKLIAVADAPNGYVFADTKSSFSDVEAEAGWATAHIEYAARRGIVNGFEDGTFRPNEYVTYGQAMKMIVCTLNYGFAVEATIPWYAGYIKMANDLHLTKNAMGLGDAPAARGLVAQLVYNMNKTAPAVQSGVDKDGKPIYSVGENTKEEEAKNTKTVEGVLLAVFNESVTGRNESLNKKEALLLTRGRDEIYLIGKYTVEEIADYLGYEVKITYSEDNSGEYVIEKISKTTANSTYTVSDIDISDVTEDSIEYFDEDSKKGITELKFSNNMYVLKNGGSIDMEYLVDELSIASGEITLIDNDDDKSIDVIFIKSYDTMYVGNVTNSNGVYTVYDKFNSADKYVFDSDLDTIDVKVMANGSTKLTDGSLSSIAATNVISVAVSASNPDDIEIIVSKRTASGSSATSEVKSIDKDNYKIGLGKEVYELSNYYFDNLDATTYPQDLSVGEMCVAYLDFTGKLAAVDKREASTSYGYITKVGSASTGMDADDYLVRMYDVSGKLYSALPVAKRGFKINGSSADAEDLQAIIEDSADYINGDKAPGVVLNAEQAVLVKYEISGNTLKSVYTVDENDDAAIQPKFISEGSDMLTYSSNTFKLGGTTKFSISTSTKVFIVPLNRNDTNYRVTTGTGYFTSGQTYRVDAFDATGNGPAKAVVVYGVSTTIKSTAETLLVENISETLDEDDNRVHELTYYSVGSTEPKTIISKDYDILKDVEPGDIIKILDIGGKVERIQHLFDASESQMLPSVTDWEADADDLAEEVAALYDGGTFNVDKNFFRQQTSNTPYNIMYGVVTLRPGDADGAGGENIYVSGDGEDANKEEFVVSSSTAVIKFIGDGSGRSDVFEFGKVYEDIIDTGVDADMASKVVVIRYNTGALKGIIIYE